jgi:hypothetical protein
MLDTLKELLAHQYEAWLSMLNLAIERCPAASWNGCVAIWKFCEVAFHVVFFTDLCLQPSDDAGAFKLQPFHVEHPADFRDYEELKDRPPVLLYGTCVEAGLREGLSHGCFRRVRVGVL